MRKSLCFEFQEYWIILINIPFFSTQILNHADNNIGRMQQQQNLRELSNRISRFDIIIITRFTNLVL